MFANLFRRKVDLDAPLSPRADAFLAEALREFNAKQALLQQEWRVGSQKSWGFHQSEGTLRLAFHDDAQLEADIQVLATYSRADRTLEWAWNNPNVAKPLKRDSTLVRKLGKELGIAYLVAGKTPVAGEEALSYLCGVGLKATNSVGVFRGKAGGPIDVLLLLKNPRWTGTAKA